ncbi:receptor-type tyrosine-protein phosphatase S-like isoform X2 [Montipora foliosa]|uniref:receptor-type tyrosine-protein phosphatase S-like isoform X2 n=1 Tax=Montipora foliosa TaxID=591990 RepID=UPI0035F19B95
MLFCKVAWLYAVASIGVAVRAFKLTARRNVITVNVRQNATLQWTYEVSPGETYQILWGKGDGDGGKKMGDVLFRKRSSEPTAQPSPQMPAKYANRVKILGKASLFIQRVDLSDAGFYLCQINGDFVTLRKEINLTVIDPPRILTQLPSELTWIEGDTEELNCATDGKPKPKVTWRKDGREIKRGRRTAKIAFRSVSYKDEGLYQCAAKNIGGKKTTEVQINVKYAPKETNITTNKAQDTVDDGSYIIITCKALGNPPPGYKFFINGKPIGDRTAEGSGILEITAMGYGQKGIYSCRPENDRGTGPMSEVTVYVRYSPEITRLPGDEVVDENNPVTVQCEAEGFPPPSIKWVKLLGNRNVANGTYLFLPSAQRSDHGRYRCIATNGFGRDASADFNINVYYAPVINRTASSKNVPAWVGVSTNLTCVAYGNPAPRYIWRNSSGKVSASEESGILQVTPQEDGFGPYTCTVQNSKGTDNLDIRLVKVAPSKPFGFEADMTGAHSARLKWRKPRKFNGRIVLFKIKMLWRYKNIQGNYKETTRKIPAKVTTRERRGRFRRDVLDYAVLQLEPTREIELKGMQPFAFISIWVSEGTGALNTEVFWSPWSNNYTVETSEGAPSAPWNVELKQEDDTSVKVTWLPPEYPNGIIRKYRIIYRNNTFKNYTAEITKGLKNVTLFYILSGLRKDSSYQISVQAFTNFPGEVSPVVSHDIVKTPGDVLEQSGVDTGSLYGGVFAGIIVLAFVIIIIALVIRNHRKQRDSRELNGKQYTVANSNDSGIGDKESLDRVPGVKYMQGVRQGSEDVVGPGKFVTIKPIPVEKLREYCEINHADTNKGFKEEFVSIRVPGNYTWENSQKPENKAKNRYKNIIPFDHTRVTLSELDGSPGSDYINANFIDGYDHHCKFIATQGPVANTFGDFWRTVWDQGVCVVVMVTNIVEGGRIKCLKYWPSASPEMYGPVLVSPKGEEELADYVVRKFSVQMMSESVEYSVREVTQYHFIAWPDQGVPTHATSLLAFLRKVRASVPEDSGPIIIHCSAGVGRTGTYIVLDTMIDQIAAEGVVDIYGFVSHIRQQRSSMVQTEAQYIFIHDALVEYVTCGSTEFLVRDMAEKLRILNTVDPDSGDSLMVAEFKNLGLGASDGDSFVAASQPENKSKNRYAILPFDTTRVTLWPFTGLVGSDYINASFVDSFQQREAFIATQAPLDNTVVDFWRMTWEYEAYSMVMLATAREMEEGQCSYYWPRREEFIVYGLLMIEVEAEDQRNGFCRRHLKITNTKSGEIRSIYHFHFTDWAERSIPLNGVGLLDMMKCITRVQQQTGNGPIIIHCSDGSGRTGTFCAVSIALERVKLDGTVDVFQTVRRLRTQRPLMVQTEEQYKFCYEITRLFVDTFSNYANLK